MSPASSVSSEVDLEEYSPPSPASTHDSVPSDVDLDDYVGASTAFRCHDGTQDDYDTLLTLMPHTAWTVLHFTLC